MQPGPMRYSQRLTLLKTAAAMGLGRFEANLILAIEQNRNSSAIIGMPSRPWTGLAAILSISLLQALILVSAWWLFVR